MLDSNCLMTSLEFFNFIVLATTQKCQDREEMLKFDSIKKFKCNQLLIYLVYIDIYHFTYVYQATEQILYIYGFICLSNFKDKGAVS